MKLAATYDHGNIFQHFGRTENFKIYDIEDGKILSENIIGNNGFGHESLAAYLKDLGVSVLICGGMGQGAQDALAGAGIEVYSGAEGNTDEAVAKYLKGELSSTGANCDHHEKEEEQPCEGCNPENCGSGCGGCCGASPQIIMEGPNAGKTVRVHYRGTFNDGTQFDSSYDRGQPLEFISGTGMIIPGFDKAVLTMSVGETTTIHLMPEEAYGMPDPRNIFSIAIKDLPGSENLNLNDVAVLRTNTGYPVRVRVTNKTDNDITFDANHEMAGKELNFQIELIEIL